MDLTPRLVGQYNTGPPRLLVDWISTAARPRKAHDHSVARPDGVGPTPLSEEQIAQAEAIFERFKEAEFLPANEAYRDETRKALDHAVLVDLLHIPEVALEPLSILRDQWCAEPSVHGGKSTRIDV